MEDFSRVVGSEAEGNEFEAGWCCILGRSAEKSIGDEDVPDSD